MTNKLLIPDRYPQKDLFICDVADAVLKDIMPQMEHPFYSLSKKPETNIRRYENNGHWLEIIPSVKGLATIYDKDILIYAISQIMAKIKAGEEPGQRVRINSYDLLQFTNRGTAGKDYKALNDALDRLAGTRITTNIVTGDEEQIDGFGLIDTFGLRRKNGIDGRLLWCEVKLSDWVFNAIKAKEVLTLHRDYFRLRKPIERRIYEIARKHCGHQKKWSISLEVLHKKSGSQGNIRLFKQAVKNIVNHNHLPDYIIDYNFDNDIITFRNRETWWESTPSNPKKKLPNFDTEVYIKAKKVAPLFDVHGLEQEYRDWWAKSDKPAPNSLEKAFLGFCRQRAKKDKQGNLF